MRAITVVQAILAVALGLAAEALRGRRGRVRADVWSGVTDRL